MAVACDVALTNVSNVDYVFVGAPKSDVTMTSNSSDDYYKYNYAVVNGEIKEIDATSDAAGMVPFAPMVKDGINYVLGQSLYAVNAYDNGRIDGYMATSEPEYVNTRISPTVKKVWAHTFDVVGDTVTMPGAFDGFTYAATSGVTTVDLGNPSFVVSDDLKVFVHDCTKLLSGGGVTIEAGTKGTLENYTALDNVIVNGLRVSKDDDTINELYLTVLPATEPTNPSITPAVPTAGTVTFISSDQSTIILDNKTEYTVVGSVPKAMLADTDFVGIGDKVSFAKNAAGQITAITAITPMDGTATIGAVYSLDELTVDGNLELVASGSLSANKVVVTGTFDMKNDSIATIKSLTVANDTTTLNTTGKATLSCTFKKLVVTDVGAESTITDATVNGDLQIGTGIANTDLSLKGTTTITGKLDIHASGAVTVEGKLTAGTIVNPDKITTNANTDPATKAAVAAAASQDSINAVKFDTPATAGSVKFVAAASTYTYKKNDDTSFSDLGQNAEMTAEIGDKFVIALKADEKVTKTLTVTAENIGQAAAPGATLHDTAAEITADKVMLKGVDDTMEYRLNKTGSWTAISADDFEFTAVVDDVVEIRVAATAKLPASKIVQHVVEARNIGSKA